MSFWICPGASPDAFYKTTATSQRSPYRNGGDQCGEESDKTFGNNLWSHQDPGFNISFLGRLREVCGRHEIFPDIEGSTQERTDPIALPDPLISRKDLSLNPADFEPERPCLNVLAHRRRRCELLARCSCVSLELTSEKNIGDPVDQFLRTYIAAITEADYRELLVRETGLHAIAWRPRLSATVCRGVPS